MNRELIGHDEQSRMTARGRLLTDNDHAAAGVPGRIDAKGIVPGFLGIVTGLGDDPISLGTARVGCTGVALVPRGGQAGTVDMQSSFSPFYFCLGSRGTASNGYDH